MSLADPGQDAATSKSARATALGHVSAYPPAVSCDKMPCLDLARVIVSKTFCLFAAYAIPRFTHRLLLEEHIVTDTRQFHFKSHSFKARDSEDLLQWTCSELSMLHCANLVQDTNGKFHRQKKAAAATLILEVNISS